MGCLTDAEAIQLDADCQAWGGAQDVFHIVTPLMPDNRQHPDYNWKSMEDWLAMIPGVWINANDGEVHD